MRLGKVKLALTLEYLVDLDNPEMVSHAKECIYEDIQDLHRFPEEIAEKVVEEETPEMRESDIPEFFTELLEEFRA